MTTAANPNTELLPILFVNYHGTMGGGQVHLLTILDGLDRKRFEPHVVCCQEGGFADALRTRGIQPFVIPFGKGKLRHFLTSIPAMLKFHSLLKRLKIRVLHVNGLQEAKLAGYPASWAKVPMVWVVAI